MAVPAVSEFSPLGPLNVFVPGYSSSAQARLLVEYALDEKKRAVNKYITITPVTELKGVYPKILAQDVIRVPHSDLRDMLWPDGQPSGARMINEEGVRIDNLDYELTRYKKEKNIGHLTRDQAKAFDVVKLEQNRLAGVLMTGRTIQVLAAAVDTANYPTNHAGTAAAASVLGGGTNANWASGTQALPTIKPGVNGIRNRIDLDTNGMVDPSDLVLVINPYTASAMAASQEIHNFLAQQVNSIKVLEGDTPDMAGFYGLPNPLYGLKVIIERSPKVTSKPTSLGSGATDGTPTYCLANGTGLVLARPGSLVSESGGINYSTVHLLEYKDGGFKVYMEDLGERDKMVYVRVEDHYTVIVPAPESGYVISSIY